MVHVANRLADGTRVVELRTPPYAAAPVLDGRAGERIVLPAGASVELVSALPRARLVADRRGQPALARPAPDARPGSATT